MSRLNQTQRPENVILGSDSTIFCFCLADVVRWRANEKNTGVGKIHGRAV